MLAYSLRRILTTIPLILVGSFFIFWGVSFAGNPLSKLSTCTTCDQSAYDRIIDLYDLDQPIPQRWAGWMGDALTGDLGESTSLGQPVTTVLRTRGWNSAMIALPAFFITAILAVMIAVYSATRPYSRSDYAITGISFFGIAMPTFFFALLLQLFWGKYWVEWTGTKPFYISGKHDADFADLLSSMTLPVTTLVIISVAAESRFGRAAMLEVIGSDYIRTARAKGLTRRRVVWRHGLRNAMIPLVTVWALDFAILLSGAVVTETVFSWPGIGPPLLQGIFESDLDLVMGISMFTALLVVLCNLLADILYGVLDPRIRYD